MQKLLFLIPALPFAGFLILAVTGRRLSRRTVAFVGAGSVGTSALIACIMAIELLGGQIPEGAMTQTLWQWVPFGDFIAGISFLLDPLSLVMVLVITVVGFLIHVYSSEFMQEEEGFSRFFAYMNLFVGSMLTLVLADNLLLLYLGWEGVGLCSYLLIGFWYKDAANGRAARKAFVVTRVGDTALALGLFLLVANLHTLTIRDVMQAASVQWPAGSSLAVLAAALLLGGAVGKSAQLPLQTWLPDAMAGPTPVSALIHAATMVTAGVYLIARTNVLFSLAPPVQLAVAVIGAATLLIAGFSALVQRDIKRVLAYSTISQIGYMFLALGVGAWSAALFHFMTHAFFKALLFLAAGVVILAQRHEHDMFRMGGLRSKLPVTFWTFLAGACSLSALPLVTAGFYSKDMILSHTLAFPSSGSWLWLAGLAGAFVTSIYTFRMVFVTFFGQSKIDVGWKPGMRMELPLVVLALFSTIAGFADVPGTLGHWHPFSDFLHPLFKGAVPVPSHGQELLSQVAASLVSLSGIFIAYLFFYRSPRLADDLSRNPAAASLTRFFFSGWGFDRLYDLLFVRPFLRLAQLNRADVLDSLYTGIANINVGFHLALRHSQTGSLRWYAAGMAAGAIVFLAIVILFIG